MIYMSPHTLLVDYMRVIATYIYFLNLLCVALQVKRDYKSKNNFVPKKLRYIVSNVRVNLRYCHIRDKYFFLPT